MQTRKHRALSTPSTLSPAPTPPRTPSSLHDRVFESEQALWGQTPSPGQQDAGGTSPRHLYRRLPGGRGGVGTSPGAAAGRTRLNVTEAERLCYSRRKLEAISALRNAGLDPTVFGLHKDYRAEGMRGKVYLVQNPHGLVYVFPTLAQIQGYAAERQARKRHAWRSWDEWLSAPPLSQPRRAVCSWRECGYEAAGLLQGQLWCQIHALLYKQMLLAYGRS